MSTSLGCRLTKRGRYVKEPCEGRKRPVKETCECRKRPVKETCKRDLYSAAVPIKKSAGGLLDVDLQREVDMSKSPVNVERDL